jgi:hypothetical protein
MSLIQYKKDGTPDFVLLACMNFLSSYPDCWDGEQILDHIESEGFCPSTDKRVAVWAAVENSNAEEILESILALADCFESAYNAGRDSAKTSA